MGIFSRRPSAYSPPLDASSAGPTLVGGANGVSSAPESDEQYAAQLGTDSLPKPQPGPWRIELRQHAITGHRSHAILALVGPNDEVRAELNGLSNSRNFGKDDNGNDKFFDYLPAGIDGSKLIAHSTDRPFGLSSTKIVDVAAGTYDDIVGGMWGRGIRAADRTNRRNLDYKGHDPAYEFGGRGGEIQSSNSVAYALGRAMGLDLDRAVRATGTERKFSGWGRDLLDPQYKPYVAPPVLPNPWTPYMTTIGLLILGQTPDTCIQMDRRTMPKWCANGRLVAVLLLFGLGSLSGCGDLSCVDGTPLEAAASYRPTSDNRFLLPLDAWTPNKDLETFIHDVVDNEGVDALRSKHGMQCVPRYAEPSCRECLTCTTTVHDRRLGMHTGLPIYIEWFKCEDYGEVLVNVDVGPGSAVRAMTYWKTTPLVREYLKRPLR
jgi:hypothetical protein